MEVAETVSLLYMDYFHPNQEHLTVPTTPLPAPEHDRAVNPLRRDASVDAVDLMSDGETTVRAESPPPVTLPSTMPSLPSPPLARAASLPPHPDDVPVPGPALGSTIATLPIPSPSNEHDVIAALVSNRDTSVSPMNAPADEGALPAPANVLGSEAVMLDSDDAGLVGPSDCPSHSNRVALISWTVGSEFRR